MELDILGLHDDKHYHGIEVKDTKELIELMKKHTFKLMVNKPSAVVFFKIVDSDNVTRFDDWTLDSNARGVMVVLHEVCKQILKSEDTTYWFNGVLVTFTELSNYLSEWEK